MRTNADFVKEVPVRIIVPPETEQFVDYMNTQVQTAPYSKPYNPTTSPSKSMNTDVRGAEYVNGGQPYSGFIGDPFI